MENEKTLYPELSEKGKQQAIVLIEKFKSQMKYESEKIIQDFYCDILPFIEQDGWTNFKACILDELCDYKNNKLYVDDYKKIRHAIYNENKDQIVKELNQDLLKDIEDLNEELKRAWKSNR